MWIPDTPKEICLQIWEDRPCQKFNVPSNGLCRLSVWIHELTELGIKEWVIEHGSEEELFKEGKRVVVIMPLNTIYMRKLIEIEFPAGQKIFHRFDHVLTSLVTSTILSSDEGAVLVKPDVYVNVIRGIPVIDLDLLESEEKTAG